MALLLFLYIVLDTGIAQYYNKMFQKFVILLVNLVLCHAATETTAEEEKGGIIYVDPTNTRPCGPKPLPNPSNPFIKWDSATLDDEWWTYVEIASNNSAWFKQFSRDEDCEQPWMPADDPKDELDHIANPDDRRIRYFWQASCPYEASWLGRFTWKIPRTNLYETCYLLWPCCQKVRIVRCTTPLCYTRTHCKPSTKIANSVCCETNFRKHKDVYVFCPSTYGLVNGKWDKLDCKEHPHLCLKLVTISVPQCCECWSCRGYDHHHISDIKPDVTGKGRS